MKSRKVTTITSDEELVRLDIFEGRIPLGEAGGRLLELALAQHHRGQEIARSSAAALNELREVHQAFLVPWPVRWWRYLTAKRQSDRSAGE